MTIQRLLLSCHHSKDKTTERFPGFRPYCSEQCLMSVCHQELIEDDKGISRDRHIAVYDPSGVRHLLMWDFVRSHYQLVFLSFQTLAKLFFSPSQQASPSMYQSYYKPQILLSFLFSFKAKRIIGSFSVQLRGLPPHTHTHTNSLILSFKSKNNDFWMPPRTFKGKHPVYKSDIVTFQIWPVRIRLSLFTKLLRKYSLNLHYLWVCLRTYTKTFNGEEFF